MLHWEVIRNMKKDLDGKGPSSNSLRNKCLYCTGMQILLLHNFSQRWRQGLNFDYSFIFENVFIIPRCQNGEFQRTAYTYVGEMLTDASEAEQRAGNHWPTAKARR